MIVDIQNLINGFSKNEISRDRLKILDHLINYIQLRIDGNQAVRLNFICTHNSRRSHLCQIWAQTAADYYKIPCIECYSGGTEETAIFPMILETLRSQGFSTMALSETPNPVYAIKHSLNSVPIIAFSKKYDHDFNPSSDFAAIMTCDHADENCPLIPGAINRIPITYEDPKAFDQSPLQTAMYKERSIQIATEMFHIFSRIKVS